MDKQLFETTYVSLLHRSNVKFKVAKPKRIVQNSFRIYENEIGEDLTFVEYKGTVYVLHLTANDIEFLPSSNPTWNPSAIVDFIQCEPLSASYLTGYLKEFMPYTEEPKAVEPPLADWNKTFAPQDSFEDSFKNLTEEELIMILDKTNEYSPLQDNRFGNVLLNAMMKQTTVPDVMMSTINEKIIALNTMLGKKAHPTFKQDVLDMIKKTRNYLFILHDYIKSDDEQEH